MRGVRSQLKCSFCIGLLGFSDALVFAFADLYIYRFSLYKMETPSRALQQHQAHLFTIKTLGVLDKSGVVPHFDILD
jgi:hypothetical protein